MKLFLLCFVIMMSSTSGAQSRLVTGKIIQDGTTNPVSMATIALKGHALATVSNEQGWFTIDLPDTARYLVITATGYLPAIYPDDSNDSL